MTYTTTYLKGGTPGMTDSPGSHTHTGAQPPRLPTSSTAFARVFSDVRSFKLRPELPLPELDAVQGRSRLLVQLLHNRGITGAESIEAFLAGNWHAHSTPPLLHLRRAADRIQSAIRDRERIVVFGDFDCDGITSCALLTIALRHLGADVTPYIPRRDDDGRGLNPDAVLRLADEKTSLIVTTDCGTANVAEIELARSRGIDVVVTDHHPPHGPVAAAYAVVNPQQDGDESGERDLAGVGVAFRLAEVLLSDTQEGMARLTELLDLVAIGTIADMVPLAPANWALAHAGLRQLSAAPRPGIRALFTKARIAAGSVTARDISFALAPRINACGRMGQPNLAVELLLVENAADAARLAERVEALNMERQTLTDQIIAAAREQIASGAELTTNMLLVRGEGWPLGILGLVAGRLADEYHRPVFVISQNGEESRGSARGPAGVNLGEVLAARAALFTRFGGHARAAGFTIPTARLPKLESYLADHVATSRSVAAIGDEADERNAHPIEVDCRLGLSRLETGSDVYRTIELLEPFGPDFPEPLFLCPAARIVGCRRSGVEGRTLRLILAHGGRRPELVWSRHGDLCDTLRTHLPDLPLVDVVFSLRKYRRMADGEPEWLPHIETLAPAGL